MDRQTRRELKHDKFVDEMGVAYSFAQGHRPQVLAVLGGAVVLVALAIAFFAYRSHREGRAQERLAEAIAILEVPVSETPATTPGVTTYKTEAEKVAKAEPILKDVAGSYSGTKAASVADLYLARFAAARGDLTAARPRLEQFVAKYPGHILAGPAQLSLYSIRIESGEGETVVKEIEKQLDNPESLVPPDALLELLSEAYRRMGNAAKSAEMTRRIVNEYPDSPYFLDAQRRLPPT